MSWTEEKVAVLRQYWGSGKSASEIAEIIGDMSRNAVIGKAHRLGLAGRPSPIKEKTAKPKPKPTILPVATPNRAQAPQAKASAGNVVELQPGGGATILSLTERMCRWPHGDPKKPGFRFCGKSVSDGSSYCVEHLKQAYQPPAPKRRDTERRLVHA